MARNWLDQFTYDSDASALDVARTKCGEEIAHTIASLAAEKAWHAFLSRLRQQPQQVNALRAWQVAVRALGRGTGKSQRQERLRRSARANASTAAESIPAWIMPRFKVAEMMQVKPEVFDVIIVDEASQCGVESLFLFYMAKKVIIVGDEMQISPSVGFIEDEKVDALRRQYLPSFPYAHALGTESSLYANAHIRFDGRVVLREHFRCAPEIIHFSNKLCYEPAGTPLDPLRVIGHPRLPPLRSTRIDDGYREGAANAINRPEAEALVNQLAGCLSDPAYEGKTFGVISLQGGTQAKLIENLLAKHQGIGPEIISKRRIACGDAYEFQGDDRDVMFLSMVSAPNAAIGTLTATAYVQRFNVAASRARDQMWLFHSVDLSDLSPNCLRYKLLEYVLNPTRALTTEEDQKFDSDFEREIYRRLTARGYRVRSQVCVGDGRTHRYRIDLVVEGLRGRLAIECDGDAWHGPDQYEKDMNRQRNLERAGWTFWRVRGSSFYASPEKALDDLWQTLDRMGIAANEDWNAAAEIESAPPPLPQQSTDISSDPAAMFADGPEEAGTADGEEGGDTPHESEETTPPTNGPSSHPAASMLESFRAIVASEGPVICSRVYDLYARQQRIRRISRNFLSEMNRTMANAVRAGELLQLADGKRPAECLL